MGKRGRKKIHGEGNKGTEVHKNQILNQILDNFQPQAECESQFNACRHKDQPVKRYMTALLLLLKMFEAGHSTVNTDMRHRHFRSFSRCNQ